MESTKYEDIRNSIQDGSIIFVHGTWKRVISALIMWCTRSKYSHCCIAFWIITLSGPRLMCVEAQGGTTRRIVNLSYYSDRELTVLPPPKPWSEVENFALDRVGKASYSWCSAFYTGLREFLFRRYSIKIPTLDIDDEICSEFCAKVFQLPNTSLSPQELYEVLTSKF